MFSVYDSLFLNRPLTSPAMPLGGIRDAHAIANKRQERVVPFPKPKRPQSQQKLRL